MKNIVFFAFLILSVFNFSASAATIECHGEIIFPQFKIPKTLHKLENLILSENIQQQVTFTTSGERPFILPPGEVVVKYENARKTLVVTISESLEFKIDMSCEGSSPNSM